MTAISVCIRCGKSRILSKTWSERVGISKITYTQNVCPDLACQKLVDEMLKDRHDVQTNRIQESLRRRKENSAKRTMLSKANLLIKEENKKLGKKIISK